MAHGEEGVLAGIQEGEDDEFGQMESGPTGAEQAVSTPFRRVLDASLRAVQGTSSDTLLAADMEEIVRRAEETITNRMSMGWDAQWHTQQSSFPGPAWGAPPADVRYGAQGYPPPSFGRGGGTGIYLQDYQAQHQQMAAALLDITLIINKQA